MSQQFSDTYDSNRAPILRYCVWRSRDSEVGEDLMQETFLRYYLCLQRKDEIVHTRAFLYRIAHNLFVNHVRKKKSSSLDQLLETGFEPSSDPWHQTHSRLDAERPLRKLQTMKASYKNVLYRRFILGIPPAEIAESTGQTSNVVSVSIFRGLKHLRSLLDDNPLSLVSPCIV